ncbi:hypothetical protein ACTXT7_005795 [Hymenolepis weldensis]
MIDLANLLGNHKADVSSEKLNSGGLHSDAYEDSQPSESNSDDRRFNLKVSTKGKTSQSHGLKKSTYAKMKRTTSHRPDLLVSNYLETAVMPNLTPSVSEESLPTDSHSITCTVGSMKVDFDGQENEVRHRSKNLKHGDDSRKHKLEPMDSRTSEETDESLTKSQRAEVLCEQLRVELMQEFSDQIKKTVEHAVDKILEQSEIEPFVIKRNLLKDNMFDKPRITSDSDKWLPEKKFRHRNSVLTDLLKISHIETVYHIFVAVLLIFTLNTILSDIVEKGGLVHVYHFEVVMWTFTGLFKATQCWIMMFLSTSLIVYVAFITWSAKRSPGNKITKFDILFAVTYTAFAILPALYIFKYDLAPASTTIVCLEQIRMMMKSHAFVRANFESALLSGEEREREINNRRRRQCLNSKERFPVSACTGDSENVGDEFEIIMSNGVPIPPFSHYLYFLFAPTLVYRNSYPRTPYVRWRFVAINLLQMGLCIIYTYFILGRFCFAYFANFGCSAQFSFSLEQLITSSFGCMLPGALLMLINFYALLHCWFNAFAELLRFGDRLFYKDWWNSTSFGAYYRTWNVVVHDWLYTYIYRDVYALGGRHRRILAQSVVFMLSAVVHEYVLSLVFRFFYPVLFFIFGGAGFAIANIRGSSKLWNIGLWAGLFMGMGILMCLYSMEWYARKNCPPAQGVMDIFIPRSWFCGN